MKLLYFSPIHDILKNGLERSNDPFDVALSIVFGSSALDPDRVQDFEVWMEMKKKKNSFFIFSVLAWRSFSSTNEEVDENKRSERSSLETFFGPGSGPYFQLCWFWDLKYIIFSQMSKLWVRDMFFYDLDGLSTLKTCEKCSKSFHLGTWITFNGQKPFYGHTCHFPYI